MVDVQKGKAEQVVQPEDQPGVGGVDVDVNVKVGGGDNVDGDVHVKVDVDVDIYGDGVGVDINGGVNADVGGESEAGQVV